MSGKLFAVFNWNAGLVIPIWSGNFGTGICLLLLDDVQGRTRGYWYKNLQLFDFLSDRTFLGNAARSLFNSKFWLIPDQRDLRVLMQIQVARKALIGIVILMFLFCGHLVWRSFNPELMSKQELQLNGAMLLHTPAALDEFRLLDHLNQPFDLDRLKGVWSIVFFAFTSCPDVCPTTLSTLNNVYNQLSQKEKHDLSVYMISLDTEHDTPYILSQYVPYFNPDFIGITGDQGSVDKLATQLNVAYKRVLLDETDYTIDHGTQLVLINPQGEYHAFFKSPHSSTVLLESWRSIVAMTAD